MKKILSLIMAFLLSASVCLFSSCAEKPCEHSFGEWETVKEASCVAGEKQRVCGNCEFTETEEIPASDDFSHTLLTKTPFAPLALIRSLLRVRSILKILQFQIFLLVPFHVSFGGIMIERMH